MIKKNIVVNIKKVPGNLPLIELQKIVIISTALILMISLNVICLITF